VRKIENNRKPKQIIRKKPLPKRSFGRLAEHMA
jgi:hypothetical protein